MAHFFILDVYVSPNRKNVYLSQIQYDLDFSFFMSQDDAYYHYHIHQNDPVALWQYYGLLQHLRLIVPIAHFIFRVY